MFFGKKNLRKYFKFVFFFLEKNCIEIFFKWRIKREIKYDQRLYVFKKKNKDILRLWIKNFVWKVVQ